MERLSRRQFATLLGMSATAITFAEAGMPRQSLAARDFTWASTGGAWGEHLESIFVEKGGFAKATGLSPQHSFQLESVAASKIVAAKGNPSTTSAITAMPRS